MFLSIKNKKNYIFRRKKVLSVTFIRTKKCNAQHFSMRKVLCRVEIGELRVEIKMGSAHTRFYLVPLGTYQIPAVAVLPEHKNANTELLRQ